MKHFFSRMVQCLASFDGKTPDIVQSMYHPVHVDDDRMKKVKSRPLILCLINIIYAKGKVYGMNVAAGHFLWAHYSSKQHKYVPLFGN